MISANGSIVELPDCGSSVQKGACKIVSCGRLKCAWRITDEALILQEVRDHAAYWRSDMAKRFTVEKHLARKGMSDVSVKVDELIASGKLLRIRKRSGDYIKEER
jgi:hypothetical protein